MGITSCLASKHHTRKYKMKNTTIILLFGLAALAQSLPTEHWELFKKQHGKVYKDLEEEISRMKIFEKNMEDILEHNKQFASGLQSYSQGVNEFTDMSLEEIIGGGLSSNQNVSGGMPIVTDSAITLPESLDYRSQDGVVTPVKNQGRCGSCYAFSATGALEGQWRLVKGQALSLSEQQVVDCSTSFGNYGCRGGLPVYVYDYIHQYGSEGEASYPYEARQANCRYDKSKVIAHLDQYYVVRQGDEEGLKAALAQVGPVSIGYDATTNLQRYRSGIFDDPTCGSRRLNHGILVVGYGSENGRDFWIVKNSWGPRWGENGYFRSIRNNNNKCGIATMATIPYIQH